MRLYLDRVLATVALTGGATLALTAGSSAAAITAGLGAAYLLMSLGTQGKERYGGLVDARLRTAGQLVAELSGAELVVFGHTHQEDRAGRYVNTGSFAYSRAEGRPCLLVDPQSGTAERLFWPRSG